MPDGARPAWPPRAMREPDAAYYVGLSPSTFRARVAPDVPGVRLTEGCVAWYREDLDAWLDRRAGRAQPTADTPEPASPGPSQDDPIRAALDALRPAPRRARGSLSAAPTHAVAIRDPAAMRQETTGDDVRAGNPNRVLHDAGRPRSDESRR